MEGTIRTCLVEKQHEVPKPNGNLRTCTFLPKSARMGGVFVAPESKDKETAQSEEQEYYFHIGTGQRAATALDMQAGTTNLAPTTSCKQWSLLQNSLPSGPLSREAPQVSEQPLRITSFGTTRSTNLMSKHLLNNPHDVFLSEMLVGNPTFCLSTLPSPALLTTRISELQRSTEHSPKRGRTSTDSGKKKPCT